MHAARLEQIDARRGTEYNCVARGAQDSGGTYIWSSEAVRRAIPAAAPLLSVHLEVSRENQRFRDGIPMFRNGHSRRSLARPR